MPEIRPDELTLSELIELGIDAVNERLPQPLLIAAARRYVQHEVRNRRRSEARRAERRAYGENGDQIDRRVREVSFEAGAAAKVVWHDVLDVRLQVAGEGQTWGTATLEDHEAAADALERLGATYVRTAAMHRRAIDDIVAAGARNLNETTLGLR